MTLKNFPDFAKLSTPDKLLLLEQLWDSIRVNDSDFLVPNSHKKELDKRLKTLSPESLLSLDELKTRVEKRK